MVGRFHSRIRKANTMVDKLELHEVVCWLLPEDKCWIRITLASGAQWIVPLSWVNDRVAEYYEDEGWYEQSELDEDPELKQLTGEDLRAHVYVNDQSADHIRDERWSNVREHATHIAGPNMEPPDDRLWAVLEQGGEIDLVTTIHLAEQRQADQLLVCDVDPTTL